MDLKKAQDEFRSRHVKKMNEVTFVAATDLDFKVHFNGTYICHAGLSGWIRGTKLSYILDGHQKAHGEFSKEDHLRFVDYFANRSPWAPCIVSKNAEEIFEDHYLLDPNYPANLVMGAGITKRFNTERNSSIGHFRTWTSCVNQGIDENLSFILAHVFNQDGKDVTYSPFSDHNSFHPTAYNKEYILNFLKGKYDRSQANYQEYRYIGGCSAIWGGKQEYVSTGNSVQNFFQRLTPRDKREKTNFNIFDIIRKHKYYAFKEQHLTDIAEQTKEWLYA